MIAVVGDSFINAATVTDVNMVTASLDSKLKARGYRVDNFGMGGLGFPSYWNTVHREILHRNSSIIVIAVYGGNDLRTASPDWELHQDVGPEYIFDGSGGIFAIDFGYSPWKNAILNMLSYSHVYRILRFRLLVQEGSVGAEIKFPRDALVLEETRGLQSFE